MAKATYKYTEGSTHDDFHKSRAKVRIFGGGYGNGKTAAAVVLALKLARDYPGSNGLIARATYPKLNDTIRKEFLKWCPPSWIKSFPRSANASNTCVITNGTTINFRYIQQQGRSTGEQTTSNLLSATYDWIVVDQMEDPEITHKDFLDLLGRLRGMAIYHGDDVSMPSSGPRWFVITTNPTRNWVYKKLVQPLHKYYKDGTIDDELIWDDVTELPMIELYESSTYENADNLEEDFIRGLEATYTGQMRDRFLLGKWAAYEGLVFPLWNSTTQMIYHEDVTRWYARQYQDFSRMPGIIEGYDYGLAVPACYGFFFTDVDGNVHLMDGFYEKELPIDEQAARINEIRHMYLSALPFAAPALVVRADPSIFKRGATGRKSTVGESISNIFANDKDNPIIMSAGNNNVANGIIKITSFIKPRKAHRSPYDGNHPAPHLYVSDKCEWFDDEIGAYNWQKDVVGDTVEKPIEKNDHSMTMIKYALSHRPEIAAIVRKKPKIEDAMFRWHEHADERQAQRSPRYA